MKGGKHRKKGPIEVLKDRLDERCLVARFSRNKNCKPPLKGVPARRVIVSFDGKWSPFKSDEKRCDYLVVAEDSGGPTWVAPVELKSDDAETHAIRQLRAGARMAARLVPKGFATVFRPILAYGGGAHRMELIQLRAARISFHGKQEPIRMIKCTEPLAKAFVE